MKLLLAHSFSMPQNWILGSPQFWHQGAEEGEDELANIISSSRWIIHSINLF
jgi:hypothetical protein